MIDQVGRRSIAQGMYETQVKAGRMTEGTWLDVNAFFPDRLGQGIGLDDQERPYLAQGGKDILAENNSTSSISVRSDYRFLLKSLMR